MKLAIILLVLALPVVAEDLPDAPSAAQPPKKQSSWSRLRDGRKALTNREVLSSKKWWIPSALLFGFSVWDAETTHAGLAHHRCVESNRNLPLHPSRGELYREFVIEDGAIIGLGFLFTKARAPHWIYDGMTGYGDVVHAKGAISWYGNCW